MKNNFLIATFVFLFVVSNLFSQNSGTQKMDTVSYSLGVLFAQNFKTGEKASIDATTMAQGFQDALDGKEKINAQQCNGIFSQYMANLNKSKYAAAVEKGTKFLAENAKHPGVKVTASGLQYEVLVPGTGPIPKATDKVKTHYHGTLLDGKVFDSSVQRGQPIDFPINGVIQGWQEALQLMPVGSKWKLFVPYNLAYGEHGSGAIGPYETLIFEVELLAINPN